MTEKTAADDSRIIQATDDHLATSLQDLREHGYDPVGENDEYEVYSIGNGKEYMQILKTTDDVEYTDQNREVLRETHRERARDILGDDEATRTFAATQPVVVPKLD